MLNIHCLFFFLLFFTWKNFSFFKKKRDIECSAIAFILKSSWQNKKWGLKASTWSPGAHRMKISRREIQVTQNIGFSSNLQIINDKIHSVLFCWQQFFDNDFQCFQFPIRNNNNIYSPKEFISNETINKSVNPFLKIFQIWFKKKENCDHKWNRENLFLFKNIFFLY